MIFAFQPGGAFEVFRSPIRRLARLLCAPTLCVVPVWYAGRTQVRNIGCSGRRATSSNGNRAVGAPASVRLSRAKQTPSEPSPSPGAASVRSHAICVVSVWYVGRTHVQNTECSGRGATSSNGNRAVGALVSVRLSRANHAPSEPSLSPGGASVCCHGMFRVRMICGTNARAKYRVFGPRGDQ